MEKIWMKSWPSFVPKKLNYPRGKKPIFKYLRDNAKEFPDRIAIIFYGKEVTYGELDRMSDKFANFLVDSGLKKGDCVAIFMPNCPQYHIAHYGINKMGGIIASCSPLFKEWELTYELQDSNAKAIVTLDLLHSVAAGACKECGIKNIVVTSMHDFLPKETTINPVQIMSYPKMTYPETIELVDILARYDSTPVKCDVGLDDPVQYQYTGGTTGLPKGAILTHGGKLYKAATLMNMLRSDIAHVGYKEDNISSLTSLPTFHILGMTASVDTMIAQGNTQVLLVMFDPVAAMQAIDRYKLRFFHATVPMNIAIMDHPERQKYDLSSLKLSLTTSFGIQLTEDIARRWKEATGAVVVEGGYGMTETHTTESFMPLDRPKYTPGCQGIPIAGNNIKIVSWEDRSEEVPVGDMGEIAMKNPAVMKGYLNKPNETKNTLIDGWIYSGDMGKFDSDGYLYFLGRKKEMIKVSGFSVFPEEVETFLLRHEAVEKVAAVGVPDERKGEIIKAYIVLKAEFKGKVKSEDIIAWAKEGISSYKVPRAIDFRDELPMSSAGKVLRRVLLEDELQGKKVP